ncbi:MAG: 50S ribosomal protein L29 [Candidatus Latescibacterota bacterium]|mgnify:CR=1 FL=1|nr:MAG: 50S ribosomal protein L29 [Candidatus Latescibacterota bacterium]
MKAYEIRNMTLEEVRRALRDAEENLANLRMQQALGQLDNPMSLRKARREVARLKTILREHELGIRKLASEEARA